MNRGMVLGDGRVIDHHRNIARSSNQVLRVNQRDPLHPSQKAEVAANNLNLVLGLGFFSRCVHLRAASRIMCN